MTKRKPATPRESQKSGQNPKKNRSRRPQAGAGEAAGSLLYGMHAVSEALSNPKRRPERLICTTNAAKELESQQLTARIKPEILENGEIGTLLPPNAVHQGILLKAPPLHEPALEDILEAGGNIAVLDQVTDPHNVGAILRSAAVFGIKALIMTDRNSPPQSGVLAKSASGALEHVAICRVGNLARSMEIIVKQGFTSIGLDGDAERELKDLDLSGPIALVLGAEGAGLRRLTREHCDWLAKLPASGPMRSLNVSNAAAVAFYELVRNTNR
ncbi:MAG: 23S rRNA (guanosine(2251)-2'-O)-methyltransferase RlmB [Parvibaculum sp.]